MFNRILTTYKKLNIVVKASIWFVVINIIDKCISILTQPIVNRILTTEEIGVFGVYSSWHSIFSILITFNLFCGVLEVYLTKNKKDKNTIAGSLCLLSILISIISFLIVIVFLNPISTLLELKPDYIIIMFATIIGESIIQFWAGPKRFEYSYKIFGLITISLFALKSVLSIFLSYSFAFDRVLGRVLGLCLPTFICSVILFFNILSKTNFKGVIRYWLPALKFNLPLIPHYLSSVILASSDRVMIEKFCSLTDVGLYSIAYTYSSLCLIVFSAINTAYTPYCMSSLEEKNYTGIKKSTHIIILFSILFSVIMIVVAPEGLLILGGNKYLDTLPIIPVLIAGIFFSSFYFIFSNVEFINKKTRFVFPITLLGALLNIGLNIWLIPIIGYEAAAYTTLIGYFVVALAHYFVSLYILKKDIFNIKVITIYLVCFLLFCFAAPILYYIHFLFRYCFVALLFAALLLIYKKKAMHVLRRKKVDSTQL